MTRNLFSIFPLLKPLTIDVIVCWNFSLILKLLDGNLKKNLPKNRSFQSSKNAKNTNKKIPAGCIIFKSPLYSMRMQFNFGTINCIWVPPKLTSRVQIQIR